MNPLFLHIQIFYEIAMSIGKSLELNEMLRISMTTILKKLNFSSCGVFFFSDSHNAGFFFKKVFSIPRNIDNIPEYKIALDHLPHDLKNKSIKDLSEHLPLYGTSAKGINFYIYLLPHIGILLLLKKGPAIDDYLYKSLVPLIDKLATACNACLQKDEIEIIHKSTVAINEELNRSEKKLISTISKMNKAEAELRIGKNRLAMILQNLADGVIVLDTDYNIILVNTMAMDLLGYKPLEKGRYEIESFLGNCKINGEEIVSFIKSDKENVLEAATTSEIKKYLLMTSSSLMDPGGSITGKILLIRDITKAKEVDRMKSEFVSNVSHELRTPITSILGFSSTILKDVDMPRNTITEFVHIIQKESKRLSRLIEDLLNLSRIESGKVSLKKKNVSLDAILQSVIHELSPLAEEKVINIIYEIKKTPSNIYGDEDAVRQVCINLIENAVKYSDNNTLITVLLFSENKMTVFQVKDEGMGIPEEEIPKIFDKFYRVYRPGKQIKGTGLGLSLVKEIIDAHNGAIEIKRRKKEGTVFTVKLPIYLKDREGE